MKKMWYSFGMVLLMCFSVVLLAQEPEKKEEDSLLLDDSDYSLDESEKPQQKEVMDKANAYHEQLLRENKFPSADTCRTCHQKHYDEWSVSPHAYAQMSPVANAMNGTMQKLTQGTVGDFCMRCHSPVSMALNEPLFMSNMDRHPASREGITCVACHRIDQPFGKVIGRFNLREGDLTQPVNGPRGAEGLKTILDNPDVRVVTDPEDRGRKIHGDVKQVSYLSSSDFCAQCHEVTLVNGARLEETFTEFKHSPAAARGVSCQDCHMGKDLGKANGYDFGPAAVVGGVPSPPRKLTSHVFAGPDYSLIHPGIFPHNPDAAAMATIREWLQFDYEAGWGTDAFEDQLKGNETFPDRWASADDRYDAREILKRQFKLLDKASEDRRQLLLNAYDLGEIAIKKNNEKGLAFDVTVNNLTDGHNAPSGFERMVFLQVDVIDSKGSILFSSGDLDPNGDVRDMHSQYVKKGLLPYDKYLFNMQSKFTTRNLRGGEQEQVLGANYSVDALPFVRPAPAPNYLFGHPGGLRLLKRGIEPLGSRVASYKVHRKELTSNRPYRLEVRLIAGMIPVNLVHAVKDAGIDYYMTPRQLGDRIVDGFQVLEETTLTLEAGALVATPISGHSETEAVSNASQGVEGSSEPVVKTNEKAVP